MNTRASDTAVRSFYEGKVVLVTGASGFLATSLVKALSQFPCSIIRLSRDKNNLDPVEDASSKISRIVDIEGDYRNKETWALTSGVDIVFHLAAQTSFYKSEESESLDYENNVLPMIRLIESCSNRSSAPVVIFAGSTTQCGLATELPISEATKDNPITTYDMHKLMAENMLKTASRNGDIFGASLRLCSVFGPGVASSSKERNVLNRMIQSAIKKQSISLYGDGSILRDFLFIDDVILAFLTAPVFKQEISGKHFIVARGESVSMRTVVHMIKEVLKRKTTITIRIENILPPYELSPIELRDDVVLSDNYQRTTGWHPTISLLKGLGMSIDHYINHKVLLDASLN